MKKLLIMVSIAACFALPRAYAQYSGSGAPVMACNSLGYNASYIDTKNYVQYLCTSAGWKPGIGIGAPTVACTTTNYGFNYTDIHTNNQYVCGSNGWTLNSSSGGPFLPLTGGTLTGQLNGTTIDAASLLSATVPVANAIYYGADPTNNQSTDAATFINQATAATSSGVLRNVYLPAGTYHVKSAITIGTSSGQCLIGDGFNTVIDVSTDFSTTANGVVVNTSGVDVNLADIQPCVSGITFRFHQPSDYVTSTTQSSAVSATSITVASVGACVFGGYIYDVTHPSAISTTTDTGLTTISGISGSVISLSQPVTGSGVSSGDQINCAQPRANFKTLAQGCSLSLGWSGCKYPWAIYNPGAQTFLVDHVLIEGAWDGIYQRGQSYQLNYVYVGAVDQGLNQDQSVNFPQIDKYMFWNFGWGQGYNQANSPAINEVYYDNSTICANLGRNDGLAAGTIQCFVGKMNFTTNWSGGKFDQVFMDGTNADLVMNSSGGQADITDLFSSKGITPADSNPAVTVTSGYLNVGYFNLSSANLTPATTGVLVNGGTFNVAKADWYTPSSGGTGLQAAKITSGSMEIDNATFDNGGCVAITNGYIQQTGGVLGMHHDLFKNACGSSLVAINSNTDASTNWISDVNLNTWTFTPPTPGTSGIYGPLQSNGATTFTNGLQIDVNGGLGSTQSLHLHDLQVGDGSPDWYFRIGGGNLQFLNASFTPHFFFTQPGALQIDASMYALSYNPLGPVFSQSTFVALQNTTPASITSPSITVGANDLVVVFCRAASGSTTSNTVTSSISNTWSSTANWGGGGAADVYASWAIVAAGATTFTCTPNTAANFQSMVVLDYSNGVGITLNTSAANGASFASLAIGPTFSTTQRTLNISCTTINSTATIPTPGQINGFSAILRGISAAFPLTNAADSSCEDYTSPAAMTNASSTLFVLNGTSQAFSTINMAFNY